MKVTIADNLFLSHTKSAFIGGDNIGLGPAAFEWELADPQTARFVTDSYIHVAKGEGQVAWLLEPFSLHPENYYSATEKNFDAVLTHNNYFSKQYGWLYYPHGGSWVRSCDYGLEKKTKNISILLSDKTSMQGHKLRHEIAERFVKSFDDILGLHERVRSVDAYRPYRFSVVVENERSDYYFTERLIDCISVGTVPIYWGCPDIALFFDARGIIQVKNIEEAGKVIETVGPNHYRARLGAIRENMILAQQYRVPEDWIYLHYPFLFKQELKNETADIVR